MGIHKVVREAGTLNIIPNAGNNAVTRELCAKNVFRISFTNWQPAHGMGLALAKKGIKKAAWITWDYAAGTESAEGFKQGLETGDGKLVRQSSFPKLIFNPCSLRSQDSPSRLSAHSFLAGAPYNLSRIMLQLVSRSRYAVRVV
jgi:ABC-type branched-subunit amino acid transport system substrate-binding protein